MRSSCTGVWRSYSRPGHVEESWRWPSLGPGAGLSSSGPPTTGLLPRAGTRPGGAVEPAPGRLFSTPRIAFVREIPFTFVDGDYEGFDLRRGGTRDASVRFKAEGKHVRIVRGTAKTPDGINVEGAGYVVIEGFIVNEMPRAGVRGVRKSAR